MTDEEIEALIKKGRKLFPLRKNGQIIKENGDVEEQGKRPLAKGWGAWATESSEDEILTELLTKNLQDPDDLRLGMVAGHWSGVVTIDCDFKHPEAKVFWDTWETSLRMGCVVNTGKGKHVHFKHPGQGIRIQSAIGGISRGVDLICDTATEGDKRYIIIPPTIHPDGPRYEYDQNPDGTCWSLADELPDIPFDIEDLIYDKSKWIGHKSEVSKHQVSDVDCAEWYVNNPQSLFSVDPFDDEPIPEGNRNNDMARVVGKFLYMNENNDNYLAEDLMRDAREINESRCNPPLPESEVEALCNSIWSTKRKRDKEKAKAEQKGVGGGKGVNGFTFQLPPEEIQNYRMGAAFRHSSETGSGVLPCPEDKPDPQVDPNGAAIWALHQPPYAPPAGGGDHTLIYLESQFYLRHNNVWSRVSDQSVESTIQSRFFQAKKSHITNMLNFIKNYLYFPIKSLPFWKTGYATPGYTEDARKLIAFDNGLFDVEHFLATNDLAGSLKAHTDNFFNTTKMNYNFNPDATCPEWEMFLASIWGSANSDRAEALREWMGHLLIPDITMQKIAVLHGTPRSGKSTIGRVIHQMIGKENSTATNMYALCTDHGTSDMVGKQLAILFDAHLPNKNNGDQALEVLKTISGGDPVRINRKYHDPYTITLTARLMLICNEVPRLRDAGNALLARLIPFKFDKTFAGQERQDLETVLYGEMEGIVIWALEGLRRYITRGRLMYPREATVDIQELKRVMNPIAAFLDDCLLAPSSDPKDSISVNEVYRAYDIWCQDNYILGKESKDRFLYKLRNLCPYIIQYRGKGQIYWKGIRLRDEMVARLNNPSDAHNLF